MKKMLLGTCEVLGSRSPREFKGVKFRLEHGRWRSVSQEGRLERHQSPAMDSARDPMLDGEPLWDLRSRVMEDMHMRTFLECSDGESGDEEGRGACRSNERERWQCL